MSCRYSKKIDVFGLDKIFCPYNFGEYHWKLIVIYVQEKRIQYYDSFGDTDSKRILNGALSYMRDEAVKREVKFDVNEWSIHKCDRKQVPQQNDGFNCGVYVSMYADFLSDNLPLKKLQFNPDTTMQFFRRKICNAILQTRDDADDAAADDDDGVSNDDDEAVVLLHDSKN